MKAVSIGPAGRWQIVLERVKTFAGAMLKSDEGSDDEDDAREGEKEEVHSDVVADPAPKGHKELMIKFKDVSSLSSQDLLEERPERKHVP